MKSSVWCHDSDHTRSLKSSVATIIDIKRVNYLLFFQSLSSCKLGSFPPFLPFIPPLEPFHSNCISCTFLSLSGFVYIKRLPLFRSDKLLCGRQRRDSILFKQLKPCGVSTEPCAMVCT